MNIIKPENVTAVILAGGMGRRMGGQDKGLVKYKDATLIERVLAGIAQQTENILINANRNLDAYSKYGYPIVEDTLTDFQGPLAGFYAAMAVAKTEYILTLPCDGPFVADNYLSSMLEAINKTDNKMAIASDGERMQPVYALLSVDLRPSLEKFLEEGERKIDRWYNRHQYSLVKFENETRLFTNINTPEDIQEFS
jgi:molybdenum cofactor guanylyltransferase